MDVISHGLWGGVLFGRRNRREFIWAFLFGVMPDIFSFGLLTFMRIFGLATGPDWSKGIPQMSEIPWYVHNAYDVTHSLFVFALVFIILLVLRKKIFLPIFAWLFHILIDIPTHSLRFFPTPFLWPFSDYKFNGISWANFYILIPNAVILVALYILFFYFKGTSKNLLSRHCKLPKEAWQSRETQVK